MTSPTRKRNTSDTEEAALVRRIVGGQRDLFGELITPYLSTLSRIVQATVGGHAEVDDIVQQTALKAFTHLAQFRFESGFRTWLIQIGVNEARQWRRKYARSRFVQFTPLSFSELPVTDQSHSPFIAHYKSETGAHLSAALKRLPEKYRNVIVLRDVEDLSIAEVAVKLGLTIPAVKSRHKRAREKIARYLGRSNKVRLARVKSIKREGHQHADGGGATVHDRDAA